MKSLMPLLVGAFIGSIAGGCAVYIAIDQNTYERGYRSGRTAAQVEIAEQIGASLGRYNDDGKVQKLGILYQVKEMSVVVIENDGAKSLRLWY